VKQKLKIGQITIGIEISIRERIAREGPHHFMILWKCIVSSAACYYNSTENKIGADGDFTPANLSASLVK
jgi:SAM-dependent MidA family methyltransferase